MSERGGNGLSYYGVGEQGRKSVRIRENHRITACMTKYSHFVLHHHRRRASCVQVGEIVWRERRSILSCRSFLSDAAAIAASAAESRAPTGRPATRLNAPDLQSVSQSVFLHTYKSTHLPPEKLCTQSHRHFTPVCLPTYHQRIL